MGNKVSYLIQLQDRFSRQGERIRATAAKMGSGFDKLNRKIEKTSGKLKKLEEVSGKAAKIGAVMFASSVLVGLGFKKAVTQSVKMEDAMADVARVVTGSDTELAAFEETLELLSETLGKSKIGLAQMAFEGGKLGTSLKDLEPFLQMVSKTAISFDLQDQEAGRAIGSIRAKMGLMNKDTQTLLDSVNFLADTTSASGARMINVIERVSGTMALLKVPPKTVAALAGFADQLEVTSELAASGMNMFINRMKRFPGFTTKLMNKPLETIRATLGAIAKMGPEVQATFIRKAFGDEAGRFVNKMVANVALFDKTIKLALSPKAAGSMQRELENKLRRSSSSFQIFSKTSTNSLDAIGDAIKPLTVAVAKFFTPLVDGIGEIAKKNPALVQFALTLTLATAAIGILSLAVAGLAVAFAFISAPVLLAMAAVTLLSAAGVLLVGRWEEIKGGAKALWEDVSMFFSMMIDPVVNFGNAVVESVLSPFRQVRDLISTIGSSAGSLFGFGDTDLKAEQNINRRSQTDVNVILRAPERLIESIKTKTSGKMSGLSVGINMEAAG